MALKEVILLPVADPPNPIRHLDGALEIGMFEIAIE